MHRQMSQRRGGNAVGTDELPFGIRAMESGIKVDGVWISRGNTPEPASRDTKSAGSSVWENTSGEDSDVDLEKQDVRPARTGVASTTSTLARQDWCSSERTSTTDKLASRRDSQTSSPEQPLKKPPKSKYPPISFARYSSIPNPVRQSVTASTLNGLEALHKATTSVHGSTRENTSGSSDWSDPSSTSGKDIGPIAASAPSLLSQEQQRPGPERESSSGFDLLNSHRMSQVAETGQLTPRGRPMAKTISLDLSIATLYAEASPSGERSDYFAPYSKMSVSSKRQSSPISPTSPKVDALPAALRRTSMPDVTPFTTFCKMAPPSPRPESFRSNSISSTQTPSPKSETKSMFGVSPPLSPIIPASEGAAELKLPPASKRTSFEKRASQVIRGHGTGFEILKPGSLNPPMPKEHPLERQRTYGPPISMHNTSARVRSNSADGQRKLQKLRRPSMESSTSSEMSRRSRLSLF